MGEYKRLPSLVQYISEAELPVRQLLVAAVADLSGDVANRSRLVQSNVIGLCVPLANSPDPRLALACAQLFHNLACTGTLCSVMRFAHVFNTQTEPSRSELVNQGALPALFAALTDTQRAHGLVDVCYLATATLDAVAQGGTDKIQSFSYELSLTCVSRRVWQQRFPRTPPAPFPPRLPPPPHP